MKNIEMTELERKKLADAGRQSIACTHGWRPIETAPKDQPILIRKIHQVGIAIHNPTIFGGWQLCSYVSFFQEETQSNMCNVALPLPTHWMPLPAPPPKESE